MDSNFNPSYELRRKKSEISCKVDYDEPSSDIDNGNEELGYQNLFRKRNQSEEIESQWSLPQSQTRSTAADYFDKLSSINIEEKYKSLYMTPDTNDQYQRGRRGWNKTNFALIHEKFRIKDHSVPRKYKQSQPFSSLSVENQNTRQTTSFNFLDTPLSLNDSKQFNNTASVLTDKSLKFRHLLPNVPSLGKANLPHFTSFSTLNESFGINESEGESRDVLNNPHNIGETERIKEQNGSEFQWWYQCVEPKLKGLLVPKTSVDENRGFQFTIPSIGQPIVGADAFIGAGIAHRYRSRYRGAFNSPRILDELFDQGVVAPPKSGHDGEQSEGRNNKTSAGQRISKRPLATYISETMAEFGSTTARNEGVPKNLPFYLDPETKLDLDTNYSSIREAHKRRIAGENKSGLAAHAAGVHVINSVYENEEKILRNQSKSFQAGASDKHPSIKILEFSLGPEKEDDCDVATDTYPFAKITYPLGYSPKTSLSDDSLRGCQGISEMSEPEYVETSDSDCNTDVSELDGASNIRLVKFIEDTVGAYSGQKDYGAEIENLVESKTNVSPNGETFSEVCEKKSSEGQIFSSYSSPEHMAYYKRHALKESIGKSNDKSDKKREGLDHISTWKKKERNAFKSIHQENDEDSEVSCYENNVLKEDQTYDNSYKGHLLPGGFEKAQVVIQGISLPLPIEASPLLKTSARDEPTENDGNNEDVETKTMKSEGVTSDECIENENENVEYPIITEFKPQEEQIACTSQENSNIIKITKGRTNITGKEGANKLSNRVRPTPTKKTLTCVATKQIGNPSCPVINQTCAPIRIRTPSKYDGNARARLAKKFGITTGCNNNKPAMPESCNTGGTTENLNPILTITKLNYNGNTNTGRNDPSTAPKVGCQGTMRRNNPINQNLIRKYNVPAQLKPTPPGPTRNTGGETTCVKPNIKGRPPLTNKHGVTGKHVGPRPKPKAGKPKCSPKRNTYQTVEECVGNESYVEDNDGFTGYRYPDSLRPSGTTPEVCQEDDGQIQTMVPSIPEDCQEDGAIQSMAPSTPDDCQEDGPIQSMVPSTPDDCQEDGPIQSMVPSTPDDCQEDGPIQSMVPSTPEDCQEYGQIQSMVPSTPDDCQEDGPIQSMVPSTPENCQEDGEIQNYNTIRSETASEFCQEDEQPQTMIPSETASEFCQEDEQIQTMIPSEICQEEQTQTTIPYPTPSDSDSLFDDGLCEIHETRFQYFPSNSESSSSSFTNAKFPPVSSSSNNLAQQKLKNTGYSELFKQQRKNPSSRSGSRTSELSPSCDTGTIGVSISQSLNPSPQVPTTEKPSE